MPTVRRFEDLRIWHVARQLVKRVYDITKDKAFREDRLLVRQIRDAASSVMSNIAEGFERGSNKEMIHFLYNARGSAGETRSELYIALDQGYINTETFSDLSSNYEALSRQIAGLIEYLKKSELKGDKFHESRAEYIVDISADHMSRED